MERGDEPESLDKEPVRLALNAAGYDGHGEPPAMSDVTVVETTQRYIAAFTRLTGQSFTPGAYPVQQRLEKNLQIMGVL
jgi:phosphoribosylaminoimidazole-succinocarboxamide synthase